MRVPALSILALSAAPCLLAVAPAQAQTGPEAAAVDSPRSPSDLELVLEPDAAVRMNLAVPRAGRPPGARPEFLDAMDELEQTLRADLAFTQLFDVQGPEDSLGHPA